MNKNGSGKSNGTDSVDSVQVCPKIGRIFISPNSEKIYVGGELHKEIRVPFREISLAPTKDNVWRD